MMIAHLPAGYLALRAFSKELERTSIFAGWVGSVAPDLDMIWFHMVDHGARHHHDYLTHPPALWAALLLVFVLLRHRVPVTWRQAGLAFSLCALLHLAFDSVVGNIAWAWPLSSASAPLVVVPATHANWVLSFLTHWTFAVELTLCATALALGLRDFARWRSATRNTAL